MSDTVTTVAEAVADKLGKTLGKPSFTLADFQSQTVNTFAKHAEVYEALAVELEDPKSPLFMSVQNMTPGQYLWTLHNVTWHSLAREVPAIQAAQTALLTRLADESAAAEAEKAEKARAAANKSKAAKLEALNMLHKSGIISDAQYREGVEKANAE